ncbi:hypothetical protein AB8E32_19360 [Marinomonas polaris]|uniref:hypothetical protein n=1 Tax=Marinomonas polaris TaxID=293552 RepID=UPI003516E366
MSLDANLCMVEVHKPQIILLKEMLDEIDPSSEDFVPLMKIQLEILDRILATESDISSKKEELSKLKKSLRSGAKSKQQSQKIKSHIEEVKDTIQGYKFLLYVWRCFGDGLVFKYISKWNIKRFLYEADSPELKQSAGNIGGKEGVEKELSVVLSALKSNVPAVLCDLTNTIRHGDVCLLGASDPHVIEVKSSDNRNARVERQVESINKIHDYLRRDEGAISGVENMKRVEFSGVEKHHGNAMNELLDILKNEDECRISPENGLYYIGYKTSSNPNYDLLFSGIKEPFAYMVNSNKTEKLWGNYYPFTLSIKSGEALCEFLSGDIYLLVLIESHIIKELFLKKGYLAEIIVFEGDAVFELTEIIEGDEKPFMSIVTNHMVGRLGLEFLSLEQFVEQQVFLSNDCKRQFNENGI